MSIRKVLIKETLLFDGAMGTWYASLYPDADGACEPENITHPERIRKIHDAYIRSGAHAIRTNTFGAYPEHLTGVCQKQVIEAGWQIAVDAAREAAEDVFVFADIGPSPGEIKEEIVRHYRDITDLFLSCGAKHFIFETLSSDTGIAEAAEQIRKREPEAFIIVSFGIQPDGFSREGLHYRTLLRRVSESGLVDAVGLNCVSGALHMGELIREAGDIGIPLCALPNAGYPIVRDNRTFFESNPEYFSAQIGKMAADGVAIVGGCCGTTPQYIGCLARELAQKPQPKKIVFPGRAEEQPAAPGQTADTQGALEEAQTQNSFFDKLMRGDKVIAVELDSPKNADVRSFMKGAAELQQAGADAITIADCPIARARMDSSILACKIRRELGLDVLPHMACRDRNINAAKALLLGVSAEGIRNVLVITGDPVPSAERNEVRSVFQFNSVKFAAYINSLNEEVFPDPVRVFGALNVNAVNFEAELKKSIKKEEAGICGFLTQPVLTETALENLSWAREVLQGKILGGIIPVISERNARFMDSEVSGIRVSERIIQLYEGKSREESEALAFEISCEIAGRIAGITDGYYLMTPFSRTALMGKIIQNII